MKTKTWRVVLSVAKGKRVNVYRMVFKATEEKADELLDALLLGFEIKDYSVGGGIVEV